MIAQAANLSADNRLKRAPVFLVGTITTGCGPFNAPGRFLKQNTCITGDNTV